MANRYTDLTPSAYNPMTFEEIAMVPMMKRKQHDETLAKQELIRSGLAKVDPLDVHFNEALQLKQGIESQMDNTALELSKNGINNDMIGKTIALNRQYQDMISPTGRIGQINAAKTIYNKEKEDFIKYAESQKIGKEIAEQRWKEKTSDYTGFDKDNKIKNITPQGVAAFQDYGQDLSRAHSILGKTVEGLSSSGHHLEQGTDGGFWEVTKNNKRVKSNNTKQVEAAYNSFKDKWVAENGEGTKYSKDAALGIDEKRIRNDFNSMLENSNILDSSESSNYNTPPAAEIVDPGGTIISNDTTIKSDAVVQPTYSNAVAEIKRLADSKSLNTSDRAKLEDLRELQTNAETKMLKDPAYLKSLKEYNAAKAKLNAKDYPTTGRAAEGELAIRKAALNRTESALNKIKDKYWKESSSLRHNYSYIPSTPKEEAVWNLHNENVFNVLKGVNLGNVLDLTSINTTGGTKKNVSPKDVDRIQDLLQYGDSKSFKINNIKTYGDNKTPEITVTFNTTADAPEYDMHNETSWNDEYGGNEKPVTVTFKLKRLSNAPDTGSAPGFKNLTGAIAGFWKDKGGVNEITGNEQGREVYNSLIENTYKDLSNQQLYARAQTDSDAREALMIRVAKHQNKK